MTSPLSLSDRQLQLVADAAARLDVQKRSDFLQRIAARLQLQGRCFTDADVEDATHLALQGLVHGSAA
jgi:hypothetical protein